MKHKLLMLFCLSTFGIPNVSFSADTWVVLPMAARGVDANTATTFGDLISSELANKTGASVIRAKDMCLDVPCAAKVGIQNRANFSLYGQISTLGSKVIVNLTAVNVSLSKPRASEKMTLDRIEDLDVAAGRLVDALVNKTDVSSGAKLGSITAQEAKVDRRRQGDHGFNLSIGGAKIFDDNLESTMGTALGLGYWFEAREFAFQPFLRFTSNFEKKENGAYSLFDIGLMIHYILGDGNVSPFFGVGLMSRLVSIDRVTTGRLGNQGLVLDTKKTIDDDENGLAFSLRAGVLLFRTYETRVYANVDYEGAFVSVTGQDFVQSMVFGLAIIF